MESVEWIHEIVCKVKESEAHSNGIIDLLELVKVLMIFLFLKLVWDRVGVPLNVINLLNRQINIIIELQYFLK